MLPLIPLAMGLAQYAPKLIGWLAGEKAEETAKTVVGIAQTITGQASPEDAIKIIGQNSDLQLKFQEQANQLELGLEREYTERLAIMHKTMQEEQKSEDKYVRRWRPTMGYALILSWTATWFSLCYVLIFATDKASLVINAISSTAIMWSVALGILGVGVVKRSHDKQVLNGQEPTGFLKNSIRQIVNKNK